jgi:hypothetical protein
MLIWQANYIYDWQSGKKIKTCFGDFFFNFIFQEEPFRAALFNQFANRHSGGV